jgi:phage baseplate assembly protein W
MARNTRIFSDIDLNFTKHPVNNDVVRKFDEEAIKQAVKTLILTQIYEKPFHSEIGSRIRGLLFENYSPMTSLMIKREITDTITNFEPRVRLIDVSVNGSPDNNEIYATIVFAIINTNRPIQVDLILTRSR